MVRKIITVAIMLCLFATGTGTAHAEEIQEENYPISVLSLDEQAELYALSADAYQGTISTTFITFFRDIVASLPITHDYVFYRSGDQEYTLVSSPDMTLEGGTFYADEGKEYVITQNSGSGYSSSYYSYSVSNVSDISVRSRGYLVYSNLGDYPQLEDRGVQYEFALLVAFCSFCIGAVIRPLSNFVLRFRNGNN